MKAKKSFIWLGILLLATIWILVRKNNVPYHSINGLVFGTIYNITYQYDGDLKSVVFIIPAPASIPTISEEKRSLLASSSLIEWIVTY